MEQAVTFYKPYIGDTNKMVSPIILQNNRTQFINSKRKEIISHLSTICKFYMFDLCDCINIANILVSDINVDYSNLVKMYFKRDDYLINKSTRHIMFECIRIIHFQYNIFTNREKVTQLNRFVDPVILSMIKLMKKKSYKQLHNSYIKKYDNMRLHLLNDLYNRRIYSDLIVDIPISYNERVDDIENYYEFPMDFIDIKNIFEKLSWEENNSGSNYTSICNELGLFNRYLKEISAKHFKEDILFEKIRRMHNYELYPELARENNLINYNDNVTYSKRYQYYIYLSMCINSGLCNEEIIKRVISEKDVTDSGIVVSYKMLNSIRGRYKFTKYSKIFKYSKSFAFRELIENK